MRTSEVLRAAKALIDTPDKWNGKGSHPRGGMCVNSALVVAVDREFYYGPAHALLSRMLTGDPHSVLAIFNFNDTHSHADMMALLGEAIANAEAAEQEFQASPLRDRELVS